MLILKNKNLTTIKDLIDVLKEFPEDTELSPCGNSNWGLAYDTETDTILLDDALWLEENSDCDIEPNAVFVDGDNAYLVFVSDVSGNPDLARIVFTESGLGAKVSGVSKDGAPSQIEVETGDEMFVDMFQIQGFGLSPDKLMDLARSIESAKDQEDIEY